MNNTNLQTTQTEPVINLGHLGIIFFVTVLLLGISYIKKPELFSFKKTADASSSEENTPHYYAYVTPAEDMPQPEVLGASTNQGPSVIGDDGTVTPVDSGEVLGASTQDITLSLDAINVNAVPESIKAVQNYFSSSQKIESGSIQSTDIAAALNSDNQDQINAQAQQMVLARDSLQKLPVPQGLVKLQKLKIIQYSTAIQLMQNFTNADKNPGLVGTALQQFLKSQQDLDTENIAMAQKYGSLDPYSGLYLNADGSPAVSQAAINNFGSSGNLVKTQTTNQDPAVLQANSLSAENLNNINLSDAGQ